MRKPNELFANDNCVDVKSISNIRTYDDLMHRIISCVNNSAVQIRIDEIGYCDLKSRTGFIKEYPIYVLRFGNNNSEKKFLIAHLTHGGERATALSTVPLLEELACPLPNLLKVLKECEVAVIPAIDPPGFDTGRRLFYSPYHDKTTHWPVRDGNFYFDTNMILLSRTPQVESVINFSKKYFKEKRGFFYSGHETVSGMNTVPKWVNKHDYDGKGPLLIESFSDQNFGDEIVYNIRRHGKEVFLPTPLYNDIMDIIQQIKIIGDGRSVEGNLSKILEYYCLDWFIHDSLGAEAVTVETFDSSIGERVEQHLICIEGCLNSFTGNGLRFRKIKEYKLNERMLQLIPDFFDALDEQYTLFPNYPTSSLKELLFETDRGEIYFECEGVSVRAHLIKKIRWCLGVEMRASENFIKKLKKRNLSFIPVPS